MKIYLITSDSYKIIGSEVEKLTKGFSNVIKYDLRIDTLEDVINEANYYSLLDEDKIIVIKSGKLFKAGKKDEEDGEEKSASDSKVLEKYLENPSDRSILIFTSYESPDKRKKLYKLIKEKGMVIEIPPLSKKDLTFKCMELLKNEGYKASYEITSYIVDNSYSNYDILTSELEKIYTLVPKGYLSYENLDGVIAQAINNTTFAYINAIIESDLQGAINAAKNFEKLKIDSRMVLIMLAKEFQIMNLMLLGVSNKEIQLEFQKQDWQMEGYQKKVSLYNLAEIKNIIKRLNDYDVKAKSGLIDKDVLLDLVALEFCA